MYERIISRLVRTQWLMLTVGLILLGLFAAINIYIEFNLIDPIEKARFFSQPNSLLRIFFGSPDVGNNELNFWFKNSIIQVVSFILICILCISILILFQKRQRSNRELAAKSNIALRASEKLFRSLYDSAAIGTALLDKSGKLTRANEAFCDFIGHGEFFLCAQQFEEFSHPDDIFIDRTNLNDLWNNKLNSFQIEKRLLHESASIIWSLITYSSLKDDQGNCEFVLIHFQNITDYKKLQEKLQGQANNDFLTQLPNRRSFIETASLELSRFLRYGNEFSVLIIDIDHFKNINDEFGHFAGDRVLKQFSQHCKSQLRSTDFISRFGGEEFAILLPETSLEDAIEIAECLRSSTKKMLVEAELSKFTTFTISVGVTTAESNDKCLETLLIRTDVALYQAKQLGRNRVCVAS